MIENRLSEAEMGSLLRCILRLDPIDGIFSVFQEILGITINSEAAVLGQKKLLITFQGYQLHFTSFRLANDGSHCVTINFTAKKKWWHGIFRDQNIDLVQVLKGICQKQIVDLRFETIRINHPLRSAFSPGPDHILIYFDKTTANPTWKEWWNISPLSILAGCENQTSFVEFSFDGAWYMRISGK